MNFSEFIRRIGAEPLSRDPEVMRARQSGPEFEKAADRAEAFERKLARAVCIPAPQGLLEDVLEIGMQQPAAATTRRWMPMALAASLVIAVGATLLVWQSNRHFATVGDYLAAHYAHDGASLVSRAEGRSAENVKEILASFDVEAAPELAGLVGFIKYCPTRDGKGAHMVLNTEQGPVTVIFMPGEAVSDGELLSFDGMQARLVTLKSGSAAIIAPGRALVSRYLSMVRDSILPVASST